jgi:hypothetical protein
MGLLRLRVGPDSYGPEMAREIGIGKNVAYDGSMGRLNRVHHQTHTYDLLVVTLG